MREEDAVLTAMAAERPGLRLERYPTALADGVESRLEGEYNRMNIAAAMAVGRFSESPVRSWSARWPLMIPTTTARSGPKRPAIR